MLITLPKTNSSGYQRSKMQSLIRHLILFVILLDIEFGAELYADYKVLNIIPKTKAQLEYLQNIETIKERFDNIKIWSISKQIDDIMVVAVSSKGFQHLREELETKAITFRVIIDDLQGRIKLEQQENLPLETGAIFKDSSNPQKLDLDRYHSLNEIYTYLETLKSLQTDISVEVKKFGQSVENRPLMAVQIKKSKKSNNPLIIIEAGAHAREWISHSTSLYIISKLIERNKPTNEDLLKKFDWLIIPVLNPDGYEYTWTVDRLWRKNRRMLLSADINNDVNNNSICNGIDLNRNFDAGFYKTENIKEFCYNTFGGNVPFSEPETKAFRDLALPLKSRIKLFVSLHSFLKIWATPFYYKTTYPPEYDVMEKLALKAVQKLESVNGNSYAYGPAIFTMYCAKGSSLDWFYEKLNVTYSVLLELPDKKYGFILPKDQIISTGREVWETLTSVVSELN